jgi:hypothetical protein
LAGPIKSKTSKSKEPCAHDFKGLYTNEFEEENLTLEKILKSMMVPKVSVKLLPKTMSTW